MRSSQSYQRRYCLHWTMPIRPPGLLRYDIFLPSCLTDIWFVWGLFCLCYCCLYRVAHKKVDHCLQRVYHTHTENFYNISAVRKTLIKMLFTMSTLRCNNWSLNTDSPNFVSGDGLWTVSDLLAICLVVTDHCLSAHITDPQTVATESCGCGCQNVLICTSLVQIISVLFLFSATAVN